MTKKIFDPFTKSLSSVFKEMAGFDVKLENTIKSESEEIEIYGVTSAICFSGKLRGRIMLDMEPGVAIAIAQNITQTSYNNVRDEMVLTTISEMNNIISGKAIAPINNELGLKLWMSPPYVFTGKDTVICIPKLSSASFNYSTMYGKVRLNIAFERRLPKMDAKSINIFLEAVLKVLGQFGVSNIKKDRLIKKATMNVDRDITALIGISGEIKGNIAYSFNKQTALKLISTMMGMDIDTIDSLGRSAIGEIANMITGQSAGMFSETGKIFNITPPSLVFGKDILFIISSVDTIAVDLDTSIGPIQVNIGLE